MKKFLVMIVLALAAKSPSFGSLTDSCSNYACSAAVDAMKTCNITVSEKAHDLYCTLLDNDILKCCDVKAVSPKLTKACEVVGWAGFAATAISLGRSIFKYCKPTPAWKVFTMSRMQRVLSSSWLSLAAALPSLGCFIANKAKVIGVGNYETLICSFIPIITVLIQGGFDIYKIYRYCRPDYQKELDRVEDFLDKAEKGKQLRYITVNMIGDVDNCLNNAELHGQDVDDLRRRLSQLKINMINLLN